MTNTSSTTHHLIRWVVWIGVGVFLLWAVRAVAFRPTGSAASFWARSAALQPGAPLPQPVKQITVLPEVEIAIWFLDGPRAFSADTIFANRLERGYLDDGQLAYFIEFDEAGVNRYLHYWFGAWAEEHTQLQSTRVDLKPGGLTIYGDVKIGTQVQTVGALFALDESYRQFEFVGVDVGGQVLAAPPDGPLTAAIEALEDNGNRALRELQFLDTEGTLTIQAIVLTEDTVQIMAR